MANHLAENKSIWAIMVSPEARKFQVAVVGVLLALVTAGLIPPDIGVWITTITSALVAAGVFTLPNKVVIPEVTLPAPTPPVEEKKKEEVIPLQSMHVGDVRG